MFSKGLYAWRIRFDSTQIKQQTLTVWATRAAERKPFLHQHRQISQTVNNALSDFSRMEVPQILPRPAFRHRCFTDHHRKGRPTVRRGSPGWQIRQGRRLCHDTSSARHDP